MSVILFDAAYPDPSHDPHENGALVYIGGDTPHVWSAAEDKAAYGRYRLPCYVRSNPGSANSAKDAAAAIAWLHANKVPAGRAVVLDLETAVDPVYVTGFAGKLHAAGYKVLPYGSKSSIFKNPKCDGYFVSDPTGVDHVVAGTVVTQYKFSGSYDLDDVTDIVPLLWDYNPPKPATPAVTATPAAVTAAPKGTPTLFVAAYGGCNWLLGLPKFVLIPSVEDVDNLNKAGIPTVGVSQEFAERLKASCPQ